MVEEIKKDEIYKLKNIYKFDIYKILRDSLGSDIANGKKVVLAYIDNYIVKGAITLNIDDSSIHLNNLIVLSKYRKKGIGTILVSSAIKYGYDNNFNSINLSVREDNDAAIKIYDNEEFIVTNIKSDNIGKYFEMTKDLDKKKIR